MSGTILFTGATGVIGEALRPRLPADRLVCLVRQTGTNGVRSVQGDVTLPRLGLDAATYSALCDKVEVVVNSAAMTRFDVSREEVFHVNVEGARNVARFARDADARLLHLSTAFANVELPDTSLPVSAKHYCDSKRAGEEVVREAGVADLHIARPSLVIGDADTGHAARLQGYHFFVRSILRDSMPVIPVEEGEMVDFVSADVVADIVAAMTLERPPGDESWLTAGPDAWEVTRFVEAVVAFAHEHGHEADMPRLVAPEMVDRLLRPVFFKELPRRVVRRFDQLTGVSGAIVSHEPFPTSIPALREHYGRDFELELERTFRASTGYLLGTVRSKAATP